VIRPHAQRERGLVAEEGDPQRRAGVGAGAEGPLDRPASPDVLHHVVVVGDGRLARPRMGQALQCLDPVATGVYLVGKVAQHLMVAGVAQPAVQPGCCEGSIKKSAAGSAPLIRT
jgi:hypothetical protein